MKRLRHWINGKPSEGSSGRYGPVHNPATGHQEKPVPYASVDEVDAAVAELITAEHGKVHSDALGEVAHGLEIVDLACGINVQLKGELPTQVASRVDVSSIRHWARLVPGRSARRPVACGSCGLT